MDLHVKTCNINLYQKGLINMGNQLYNSVPINRKKLEEFKPYKRKLKSFHIDRAFYSVEEFLCYWSDATAAWAEYVNNNI
jgi:hypothetical protein